MKNLFNYFKDYKPKYATREEGRIATMKQMEVIAAKHSRTVSEHFEYVEHSGTWTDEDKEFHDLHRLWGVFQDKE